MEAILLSPSATKGEEKEEKQSHKAKKKRGVRSKSHGRKSQRIPSLDRVREPERMPPIHEDDFEDIRGYHIEEPRQMIERVECRESPLLENSCQGARPLRIECN